MNSLYDVYVLLTERCAALGVCEKWILIPAGLLVALATVWTYKKFNKKPVHEFPSETVVVYKYGTAPTYPCWSPFTVKLETYLRLAGIPYETVHGVNVSKKGKIPWIEHRGNQIADTQFCIDYINKQFNVNLNKDLDKADKGVAHAMRILADEHLYWCALLERWVYRSDPDHLNELGIPWSYQKIVPRFMYKQSYAQGIGRHTKEEVFYIAQQDFAAFAAQLGTKKFMFGDKPVESDCAIFGMLSWILYSLRNSDLAQEIREKHTLLAQYVDRMRDTAWPDWSDKLRK